MVELSIPLTSLAKRVVGARAALKGLSGWVISGHSRVCPTMGQTVTKQPLWGTFWLEKPEVFWAFSRVQVPSARHLPRGLRSRLALFPTSTNMDEGTSLACRSPDRTAHSVKRVTPGLDSVSPEVPNFPLTPPSIKALYCGDFCGDSPYKYTSSDVRR